MSKFILLCSCTSCKTQTTVQSLKAHLRTHKPKANCVTCNIPIYNANKFCSSSCAGKYTNSKKDWSKIKTGPKKGYKNPNRPLFIRVKQCVICGKFHPKQSKSCSKDG